MIDQLLKSTPDCLALSQEILSGMGRVSFAWIIWPILLPLVFTADLSTTFTVKPGTKDGGCKSYVSRLVNWYSESVALLNAGIQCFVDAENGNTVAKRNLKLLVGVTARTSAEDFRKLKCQSYILEPRLP